MPAECEFDPLKGRALEDQEEFVMATLWGMRIPRALMSAADAHRPDVVVVDQLMRSTLSAAERVDAKRVVFAHTAYRFYGDLSDPEWTNEDAAMTNHARTELGLEPVALRGRRVSIELMATADRVIVAMIPEFDPWDERLENVEHVGPLFEEDVSGLVWESPWRADEDTGPLVVVSLSSQYMHQEDLLARIFEALDTPSWRVLLLTGHELAADEIDIPANAVVEEYVPHLALLPHADLVVTHGGMGTIMAAFACAAPLVCIPLGRDQPGNAAMVQELGAGVAMPEDPKPAAIREGVLRVLDSQELHRRAAQMAEIVASYGGGMRAVEELEALLPR